MRVAGVIEWGPIHGGIGGEDCRLTGRLLGIGFDDLGAADIGSTAAFNGPHGHGFQSLSASAQNRCSQYQQ